jgi:adenylate cyclase
MYGAVPEAFETSLIFPETILIFAENGAIVGQGVVRVQFAFEDQLLDPERRELRRGTEAVAMEPQVFDLLLYLVQNRDRIVSKDDLIAGVWGGRIVSESTLTSRVTAVRKAIGDSGAAQRLIRTVPRKGLRFVGPVQERSIEATHSPLTLPDQPSIAVLPFDNLSGKADEDYFADGLAEDIITAMSRVRWLFVIARNSSFTYKGRAVDVRQVGRELGVRYVLEGSIRVAGRSIRVSSQLIDAGTGRHLWAEKYDRQLEDIFKVQDEITGNVIAAIEPRLFAEEGYRAQEKAPDSLDAWGLVARALSQVTRLVPKQNRMAQRLLRQAIAIEPGYARAHAILGWALWWEAFWLRGKDAQNAFDEALRQAAHAVALDPQEPWARMAYGIALVFAGQQPRALDQIRAALELNPNSALARALHGAILLGDGQLEPAAEETAKALRMSPVDDFSGLYSVFHGAALLCSGRFQHAVGYLRKAVTEHPDFPGHYNALISCCGHLGLLDEASRLIERRNGLGPPLHVNVPPGSPRLFAHLPIYADGLRKAGVPD